MVKEEAEHGDEIVRQINAGIGVREIDFSVQACSKIPIKKLDSEKALLLCKQIVAEIFQQAGITQKKAPMCWDRMVDAIRLPKMLKMTVLEQHERWVVLDGRVGQAIGMVKATNKHVSLPPEDLGFVIAALLFRRLQPSNPNKRGIKNFIELFGTRNAMQWLNVAIAVSKLRKVREPFIIEIDDEVKIPTLRWEEMNGGKQTLVVVTRPPAVNIYEADMLEAIRLIDGQSLPSDMRTKTPDLPNHNEELIDPRSDTTQAELLAPTADHREPQPHRELFERYKLLWKGSLREHGSILGSLRELVYQDCTDEQIFYLEETEKDFLAERMG